MKSFTKSLLIFLIICHLLRKQSIESKTADFITQKKSWNSQKLILSLITSRAVDTLSPYSSIQRVVRVGSTFERRQFVRNSWVKELKEYEIDIYFTIALNKNQTINEELREESDTYKDMIQFPFIDAYYNLTWKRFQFFDGLIRNVCPPNILKSDDDGFINSALLIDKLSQFGKRYQWFSRTLWSSGSEHIKYFTNNLKGHFFINYWPNL